MALYVKNEDGTHFLDEDGNKIEYTIKYPSDVVFIDQPDFLLGCRIRQSQLENG